MKTKTNLIVEDAMKAVSSQVRLPECIRNGKIKNMTQYKLIKTPEQFIIISDSEVTGKKGYNPETNKIEFFASHPKYNESGLEVIAQQEQIDFNGFEQFIQSLQPKEWIIEIAMEQYTQNYHKDIWYNRPLLINDKIQITKIL
jgi:hypothetical protein